MHGEVFSSTALYLIFDFFLSYNLLVLEGGPTFLINELYTQTN
jgi:hypothetical protein